MDGIRIPWGSVLAAMDKDSKAFEYFYLKQKPKDEYDSAKYAEVQDRIRQQMKNLKNWYKSGGKKQEQKLLINHLISKRDNSIKQEAELFVNVLTKAGIKASQSEYVNMCGKAYGKNIDGKAQMTNHTNIEDMTPWEFWTKASNDLLYGQNKVLEKIQNSDVYARRFAMTLLIMSRELYEALKRSGETSLFSRHVLLRGMGKDEAADLLDDKFSLEASEQLIQDIDNWMNQQVGVVITEQAQKIFEGMRQYTKKHNDKSILATSFSAKIREDMVKLLKELGLKDIKLTTSKGETYFYASATSSQTAFYQNMFKDPNSAIAALRDMGLSRPEFNRLMIENGLDKEAIRIIMQTIIDAGVNLSTSTLDLMNLGKVDLNQYFDNLENFKRLIKDCEKSENLAQLVDNYINSDKFYKSFMAINSNAHVSGLLGELGAKFNMDNLGINRAEFTGSIYNKNSGSSANDIRLNKMGVNVKHYIYNTNSLTLYEGDNFLETSTDRKFLNRYLGWEDLQIIQFVTANAYFFQGNKEQIIKDIAYHMAYHHIPEFYRINVKNTRDGARDYANILFELNNVVYPTSYVYECAINQLNEHFQEQEDSEKSALFDIRVESKNNFDGTHFDNLLLARETYDMEDFRISNIRGEIPTTVKFKTKGLKINLMSLSLFE